MEQSTTTQPVAHLGVAVHHESLQVAESHLSTAHLTGGKDSARNGLVLCRQLKREVEGVQLHLGSLNCTDGGLLFSNYEASVSKVCIVL